jgi:ferric-dicitrate binding protein FerR (iron transport regulator)
MATERIWELMARKLAGEASEEELKELEQSLRTHPDLHFPIQAITDLWQHSSQQEGQDASVTTSYQQHITRMQQQGIPIGQTPDDNAPLLEGSRKPSRRRSLLWTAAAACILLAAWGLYSLYIPASNKATAQTENNPSSEITTRNGSRTRVQLPDGTHVWLNAGSKLTYNKEFGGTIREVTLIGEGYFDVVRNEKKPFVIHTTKMDVKVLGTQFNVKSYPNDKTTEAALIHGSIEVSLKDRPSQKIILKPNEKIVVANRDTSAQATHKKLSPQEDTEPLVIIKHLTYQKKDSAIVETSWLENKLAFEDESFRELAHKMERWYGVTIYFKDEKTAAMRFTGAFEDETIEEAMHALKITASFNYTFQGKTITVSHNDY